MPKKAPAHTQRDYAMLEKRYRKLLRTAVLPREQQDQAINALLDEAEANSRQNERPQDAAQSVVRDEKQAIRLEDVVADVTEAKKGTGYILPGPSPRPPFPMRSPDEMKALIMTFLDLLINEKPRRPN